jgi:hypothetical protein
MTEAERMPKELETRYGCMSHKGIHFELFHENKWKKITVNSREVVVHYDESLPDELKSKIFKRIDGLFH